MIKNVLKILLLVLTLSLYSCREDGVIFIPEHVDVSIPEYTDIKGFYLLNEGNMGNNKCTLDYYDYEKGEYIRNIYGNANPSVPKELGDVGNDIAIYGDRLYAVVNCSNKVEVMDVATTKRIGQIDIPNCRYIKFHKGFAYVTSYAGPVEIRPDYEQLGYVAKVDTATLEVVDECVVGFQPEALDIADGKIYVANSGGYMVPNYESTVSVIDIEKFKVVDEIEIDINLQYVLCDKNGCMWVTSRGDYYNNAAKLYCYDLRKKRMVKDLDVAVSDMHLDGDSLYIVSAHWSHITMTNEVTYGIVDINLKEKVCDNFIKDGTEKNIRIPYGVTVNSITKDIYVTDAKNYVSPGTLFCFGKDGIMKWKVRTGDIPAHFAFVGNNVNEK